MRERKRGRELAIYEKQKENRKKIRCDRERRNKEYRMGGDNEMRRKWRVKCTMVVC